MNTTTRLTIPMDDNLRSSLSSRADELGFDSAQALLRYVSKAIVDGREVTFGETENDDDWNPPPAHVIERWQKDIQELEEDVKAGRAKTYTDIDEMMKDLRCDEV